MQVSPVCLTNSDSTALCARLTYTAKDVGWISCRYCGKACSRVAQVASIGVGALIATTVDLDGPPSHTVTEAYDIVKQQPTSSKVSLIVISLSIAICLLVLRCTWPCMCRSHCSHHGVDREYRSLTRRRVRCPRRCLLHPLLSPCKTYSFNFLSALIVLSTRALFLPSELAFARIFSHHRRDILCSLSPLGRAHYKYIVNRHPYLK